MCKRGNGHLRVVKYSSSLVTHRIMLTHKIYGLPKQGHVDVKPLAKAM